MQRETRDSLLGVLSSVGILMFWRLIIGNAISIVNIGFGLNIPIYSLESIIFLQLVPFLVIGLLLYKQLSISKEFERYFLVMLVAIFIGEVSLAFWVSYLVT